MPRYKVQTERTLIEKWEYLIDAPDNQSAKDKVYAGFCKGEMTDSYYEGIEEVTHCGKVEPDRSEPN